VKGDGREGVKVVVGSPSWSCRGHHSQLVPAISPSSSIRRYQVGSDCKVPRWRLWGLSDDPASYAIVYQTRSMRIAWFTHRDILALILLSHIDAPLARSRDIASQMRPFTWSTRRRHIGFASNPFDGMLFSPWTCRPLRRVARSG